MFGLDQKAQNVVIKAILSWPLSRGEHRKSIRYGISNSLSISILFAQKWWLRMELTAVLLKTHLSNTPVRKG